jgi:hypothetical protein
VAIEALDETQAPVPTKEVVSTMKRVARTSCEESARYFLQRLAAPHDEFVLHDAEVVDYFGRATG